MSDTWLCSTCGCTLFDGHRHEEERAEHPTAKEMFRIIGERAKEPTAENGVTRCECGCKYWEGNRCVDCGDRPA